MAVRVGVIGATGFTAYEAIRLLLRHPHAEVTVVTSRQDEGHSISQVHPQLTSLLDLKLTPLDIDRVASEAKQRETGIICNAPGFALTDVLVFENRTRMG